MSDAATRALIERCEDQAEDCLYTAVSFHIWLRQLRWGRAAFVMAPVVFGALATANILVNAYPMVTAIFALLATVLPPLLRASKLDASIAEFEKGAAEFINVRDRFIYLARVSSQKPFAEFEAEATPIFDRLEKARRPSLTAPERCFEEARRKIRSGHYDPDRLRAQASTAQES